MPEIKPEVFQAIKQKIFQPHSNIWVDGRSITVDGTTISRQDLGKNQFEMLLDLIKAKKEGKTQEQAISEERSKTSSNPTIAEKLESTFDKTVGKLSKKAKATILSREGHLFVCPNCLDPDSVIKLDKTSGRYACPKCNATISREEFQKISNIENLKGVLIDFNIRKDVQGHLVLDHHDGLDKGNIMVTATTQVIDYIKLIKKNPGLSSFRLLTIYRQKIMQFSQEGKLNIFANHLDLDMFLAQFAFRNPNAALKHEDTLTKLSRYGDLMKIDASVKRYYLIIQGYFAYLKLKLEKNEKVILETLVGEMRNILEHPEKYKRFEEEEDIRLKTAKEVLDDWNRHFKPFPKYENSLLEYISTSENTRIDAVYEIIMEKHGGAFNNPLIINLPLVLKTDLKHTSFNLAVNPNREGFEQLDLTVFREPLESAEKKKITDILSEIGAIPKKIDEKKSQMKQSGGNEFAAELDKLKKTLMRLSIPEIIDGLERLQRLSILLSADRVSAQTEEIRKILLEILSRTKAFTQDDQKKELFGDLKNIENIALSGIPDEIKSLEHELKKSPKKSDLEELIKQNREHNIWRIKPNLIIINPRFRSLLTFDEIMDVITSNLKKLGL